MNPKVGFIVAVFPSRGLFLAQLFVCSLGFLWSPNLFLLTVLFLTCVLLEARLFCVVPFCFVGRSTSIGRFAKHVVI